MWQRILLTVLLAGFLPWSAQAAGRPDAQKILSVTTVSDAAPLVVSVTNKAHQAGYLVIRTTNEVTSASLVASMNGVSSLGSFVLCDVTRWGVITTNTTTVFQFRDGQTTGNEGIGGSCENTPPENFTITFTQSVADKSFDVEAEILWFTDGF